MTPATVPTPLADQQDQHHRQDQTQSDLTAPTQHVDPHHDQALSDPTPLTNPHSDPVRDPLIAASQHALSCVVKHIGLQDEHIKKLTHQIEFVHEPLIDAGHQIITCALEHIAVLDEQIEILTHDLDHASSRVEALEGELAEAKQHAHVSENENEILREENRRLSENLNNERANEQAMVLAFTQRLRNLHEDIQNLNAMVSVLKDEAHAAAEVDQPGSRYYFEGGWEDVARLWREGKRSRIPPSSEPEAGNGHHTDTGPNNPAYWFERSNAPSPEERRPRHDERDALRQIDMEMVVLQLQDRLERAETRIKQLTDRCEEHEGLQDIVAGISRDYEECIAVLLGEIYEMQEEEDGELYCNCGQHMEDAEDEEDDGRYCTCGGHEQECDEEEDDEPYCTCGQGWEELRSTDEHATLRGGMGGRDEDEEFVYGYGGYTNWDQVDEPAQDKAATSSGKDEIILELRRRIQGLEAQIRTLTEAARRVDLSQTVSVFDEEDKKDQDGNLRSGSGEEEPETGSSRDIANTEDCTSVPASPHLLCQRVTSRIGESTINYIIVYLPPGFVVPDSSKPDLVFHNAVTIYYFPTGATDDLVQREVWNQKACGERHWQAVGFHKIQSKQVFKNTIADMWKKMGLIWDILTRGYWEFEEDKDKGDMYMVNDNNLFLTNRTQEVAGPRIRGGSGEEPTAATSHHLQSRNSYLERELSEYKEINGSLIQDLHWLMNVQVELEERLEAAEADKKAMTEEYRNLRTLLTHLVGKNADNTGCTCKTKHAPTDGDRTGSPVPRTMQDGDEDVSQPTTSMKQESAAAVATDHSQPFTAITADSFVFYPQRSTIVFPGNPPHIYLFPSKSTLPEIHRMVKNGSEKEDLRSDPYVARILAIMNVREDMGIYLPENVSDERIIIDIPEVLAGSFLDRKTKIAAWQAPDTDLESLERLVKKLEIGSNTARNYDGISTKTTSSEGEEDHFHDVGDLVNSLGDQVDIDNGPRSPGSHMCQACSEACGSEANHNVLHLQSSPKVSVRGGGGDPEYWSRDTYGNREFPLLCPKLSHPADAFPHIPTDYGTTAPAFRRNPLDEEIATSNDPLSMRLGRLMFPPRFVQERENSIRGFDWQRIKRLSPQFRDKSSRSFRYAKSAHCEEWAVQLNKHREHCDYCQAVFTEEDYTTRDSSPRHEDEAPEPRSGTGRPWKKSTWSEDTATLLNTTVEDPNPRLRGGAGSEKDLCYDSCNCEDWRSEWNDLASQTQYSGQQPRTYRNSSTLSTKTMISSPSPVDRSFKSHHQPQDWDLCTAMEFLRTGSTFSEQRWQANSSQIREARSKISHPFLLETQRSRNESILERPYSKYDDPQYGFSLCISVVESDSVLDLRAENWLENPRPAPPPPSKPQSISSSKYSQQSHDVGLTKVYGSDCSTRFNQTPRGLSFRSDRHEFFPVSEHSNLSENTMKMRGRAKPRGMTLSEMLSDEMYEEHVRSRPMEEPAPSSSEPRLGMRLCKRCAELLAILAEYIRKLGQRLIAQRSKKSASRTATNAPATPAPSRMGWETRYMNRELPPLPFDRSLPPTPRASVSTLYRARELKEKFPAVPEVTVSLIERARAIALEQDRAHAEFISQEGGEWHIPTIAGPSDPVKEALMWLQHEDKLSKIRQEVFGGGIEDDTAYEYDRSN